VNNAVFYSLQKGEAGGHLPPAGLSISNFTSELSDLADTAALIQNLDLVITVGHVHSSLGRGNGETRVGDSAEQSGLAMDVQSNGFSLVSDDAAVPPAQAERLDCHA
jgi:hypothetical protein